MFKLLKNLRTKDIFVILLSTVLIVFQVWLDLKLPKYMQTISTLTVGGAKANIIWEQGLYMLLCTIGSVISSIIVGFLISRLSSHFAMRLRNNIFNKVESFSLEQIKRFSTSSLITRTTNDVTHIQMLLAIGVQSIIKAPITAIWAICEMSATNYECSIATAIAVAFIVLTISIAVCLSIKRFKRIQTLTDDVNRLTQENLEGIRVVRAYNAEKYEQDKFNKTNKEMTKTSIFAGRAMDIIGPVMQFVMSTLTIVIYLIGSKLLSNMSYIDIPARELAFGEIMSFSMYAMQVIMAFMMLTIIFIMYPRAEVSAKRINEVLDTKTTITDGEFDKETKQKGIVEFKNVSFKYPNAEAYVLENISFSVKQGQTVAFIGSTGSGKSTLINLVPRFYDVTDGEILVDGINIKNYKLETLRNKMGYISQKAILFSGSIKSNLTFGEKEDNKISTEKIDEAIEISCSKEFIDKLENKEKTILTQGGTNVSGGQKQRLSIARAIAKKPEILIFDDSFSALDYRTDKKLRSNLNKKLKNTTKLIVAQRIGTIKDADLIVVLNEGKIAGLGTNKELLKNCPVYKEIALSQLSQEEIDNELK